MKTSYKGKILISTPDLSEDIFSRSVILIIEHNEHGAFGLILNKLNQFLTDEIQKKVGEYLEVYEGGPVENNKILAIVKGEPTTEYYMKIDQDFYVTEDVEMIIFDFIEGKFSETQIKFFSGYSGWSPEQLETEIKNKFWTIVDSYQMDYTVPNTLDLWKKIMQNLGGDYLLWANSPKDISLN